METTEIEVIDLTEELSVFDPVAHAIAQAKEKNANLIFDYEDKKGTKDARSHIAQLRRLKAPVNEVHKLAKAEALKFTKALDGKKRELIGAIDEMIQVHHEPIWEIEQREAAIEAEKQLEAQRVKDAEEEKARLELEAREKAVADERALLEAEKREMEQKAREAQAALDAKKEAEAQAKRDLEAAENRRLAEVQAIKDKAAAEVAEKERKLAEKEKLDRAYQLELESQEQERVANVEHRRRIHEDIYKAICGLGMTAEMAGTVSKAIIYKQIPHVTINY